MSRRDRGYPAHILPSDGRHPRKEPVTTTARRTSRASGVLRTVQVLAALSVLNLLYQFTTAGALVGPGGSEAVEELHGTGAIVLHVLTGLTAIAAGLHGRATRGPLWPTVLAAVVFLASFAQAYTGGGQTLWIHVPGAMVLTVGSVWVLAWSFTRGARG